MTTQKMYEAFFNIVLWLSLAAVALSFMYYNARTFVSQLKNKEIVLKSFFGHQATLLGKIWLGVWALAWVGIIFTAEQCDRYYGSGDTCAGDWYIPSWVHEIGYFRQSLNYVANILVFALTVATICSVVYALYRLWRLIARYTFDPICKWLSTWKVRVG